MSNGSGNGTRSLRLVLQGKARLERGGWPIRVRRRGLALLAYVATVGEASRAQLGELLWPAGKGRSNLRVELHRLSDAVGSALFEPASDPVRLPAWVDVDVASEGDGFLEDLEGISEGFDAWIASQRVARNRGALEPDGAAALARSLAATLRPPFLVLVRAKPGVELDGFVKTLGEALRLPVIESGSSNGRAIHVITPPYPERLARTVLADRHGSWVVRVPAYGEDPQQVLALRNAYEPGHVRYVELPAVAWRDARDSLLASLPFGEAAEAYLWSGGNEGLLRELGRMRWARDEEGRFAVPQRVRAAYQIELRHASMRARHALERLSVHPAHVSNGLIDVFEARSSIDELERRGWLVYDGAWRFRESEARTVLYSSVHAGRRMAYHRAAARHFAAEGRPWAHAFHALAAGEPVDLSERPLASEGIAWRAVRASMGLPVESADVALAWLTPVRELALLEVSREGDGLDGAGAEWSIVRSPGQVASAVTFELPASAGLLHITGRAVVGSPLGIGLDGGATPLELAFGQRLRVVFLAGLDRPTSCGPGVVLMPLGETVDYWLALPHATEFRLVSRAEAAVMELEVTVHAAQSKDRSDARVAADSVPAVEVAWPVFASTTAASSC